jgi:predicted RNA-binding Zn ribbon-like protein
MTAEPYVDYDAVLQYRRSTDRVAQWIATARFRLRPAPSGLALVQDFLNTEAQPQCFPDLLATAPGARRWSARAARAWSRERQVEDQAPVLTGDGLAELRHLRGSVEELVTHGAAPVSVGDFGEITLSLSRIGELCWTPIGNGWRWWSAAVGAEILASREKGTWSRLKQCATPTCRVAFYDRSWNNSGLLHASACRAQADEQTDSRPVAEIGSQRASTFFRPTVTQARS